ncbi:MAG: FmdB family transcriptional regulator [Actinobacteria bacterium]|nr:FmdB family transcriptional regulator [Actinomycetota bacterium]
MPIYEYACRSCGNRLEELQKLGEGPPGPCPRCGGELRRAYGRVGVRFSGWGFSRTDALLPEGKGGRRDYRELKDRADRLRDEG